MAVRLMGDGDQRPNPSPQVPGDAESVVGDQVIDPTGVPLFGLTVVGSILAVTGVVTSFTLRVLGRTRTPTGTPIDRPLLTLLNAVVPTDGQTFSAYLPPATEPPPEELIVIGTLVGPGSTVAWQTKIRSGRLS